MSELTVLKDLPTFFNTLVKEGLESAQVKVSPSVGEYLSKLLVFYVTSDHLFSISPSGKRQLKTLAELYLQSHSFPTSLKSNLKRMGDMSLYISGFFRESLKRKRVSVEYYMHMGKSAYQSLSEFQQEGELFKELAFCFSDLVCVLFQIRKKSIGTGKVYPTGSTSHYSDTLALLDQYMETGSDHLAKELIKEGISLPVNKKTTSH